MYNINGWLSIAPMTINLVDGDNVCDCSEFIKFVPATDNCRVVGFNPPPVDEAGTSWLMEVGNDPAQTNNVILLIAGTAGQLPHELILPTGNSTITLPPGATQRLIFVHGIGWLAVLPGVIS